MGVGESVAGAPLRATESLRVPDSPPLRSAEFDRNRAEVDALHRELRMVAALEVRSIRTLSPHRGCLYRMHCKHVAALEVHSTLKQVLQMRLRV